MRLLLFILMLFVSLPTYAQEFDYGAFRQIPVLDQGRIKPMDSYARTYLKAFHGRENIEDMNAIEWIAETLFDRDTAYKRPLFNIENPDVLHAIGLEWRNGHRYNFLETIAALDRSNKLLNAINNTPPEQRSITQQQLMMLYEKVITYGEISRALLPDDNVKSILERDHKTEVFRIIPPQWQPAQEPWLSPYSTLNEGEGSPQSATYLKGWKDLKASYNNKDSDAWNSLSQEILNTAINLSKGAASPAKLKLETTYHMLDLFKLSLALYLLTFLLLTANFFVRHTALYLGSLIAVYGAAFLQLAALIMRMIILSRPPVSTLYETTIFVSLIAVTLCLVFEWKRKDGAPLLTASIIGSVLLFISMRYAAEGDTLQVLVAVLNTNFWLATHVVTITIGYGCALVAGTLAHIYLIRRAVTEEKDKLFQTTLAVSLIALLFCIIGTILGGIWADQSWGRFWGWDPKENGAMLICLWLLWILHGHITGLLSRLNIMSFMVVTNIIVALAWFGVNLLNVGLHSYGFTEGIAINLALFCGLEVVFLAGMRLYIARKDQAV